MCSALSGSRSKRVLKEVDLADAQVVGGAPVAIHLVEHIGRERALRSRFLLLPFTVRGDRCRQSRIEEKGRPLGGRMG